MSKLESKIVKLVGSAEVVMELDSSGVYITVRRNGYHIDGFHVRKPYFYERWLFGTTWASRSLSLFEKAISDEEAMQAYEDDHISEAAEVVGKVAWALRDKKP